MDFSNKDMFEIKVMINDEKDLYNRFDPDEMTLSSDVVSYIYNRYSEKEFGKKVLLRIEGAEVDEDHFKKIMRQVAETEYAKTEREKKINFAKQLRLFIIGLILIVAGIILKSCFTEIPLEIISIVGTFAIWESANIWLVKRPELNLRMRKIRYLSKGEIVFGNGSAGENAENAGSFSAE